MSSRSHAVDGEGAAGGGAEVSAVATATVAVSAIGLLEKEANNLFKTGGRWRVEEGRDSSVSSCLWMRVQVQLLDSLGCRAERLVLAGLFPSSLLLALARFLSLPRSCFCGACLFTGAWV